MEMMRSPWVTSTDFPPNPVLLTYGVYGGTGLPLLLQSYPTPSANMVKPPIPGFAFASSARILANYALCVSYALPPPAVCWRLSLVSRLRCQAHKRLGGKPYVFSPSLLIFFRDSLYSPFYLVSGNNIEPEYLVPAS